MKALVCSSLTDDFAGIRVEDVDLPEPGAGEVRIRILATSLNYPDILLCQVNIAPARTAIYARHGHRR